MINFFQNLFAKERIFHYKRLSVEGSKLLTERIRLGQVLRTDRSTYQVTSTPYRTGDGPGVSRGPDFVLKNENGDEYLMFREPLAACIEDARVCIVVICSYYPKDRERLKSKLFALKRGRLYNCKEVKQF